MDCYQIQTISAFSFGQSSIKPKGYVSLLHHFGYLGGGISDPNSIFSFPELDEAFRPYPQMVPFYGALVTIKENEIFLEGELLILDEEGYFNLVKILNQHKEVYALADFASLTKGLAFILKTEDPKMKDETFLESSKGVIYQLSKLFNPFYFGIEIYSKEDNENIKKTRGFASSHSYDVLAFPKVCYLDKDDGFKAYKMLNAIVKYSADKTVISEDDLQTPGPFFLLTPHVMTLVYSPEENAAQADLAKKIHFSFMKKRALPLSSGVTDAKKVLHDEAYQGLEKKLGGAIPPLYRERLDYELDVIDKMGFDDYFLIVQDYVGFAKKTGIKVGPGRGSGCGSLVSYAIDITQVDSVKYGLDFERFLNPLRKTMPDIDMDFQDDRRQDVINYLKSKYGSDRVAMIVTFNTLQLRASVRQIGNIFGLKPERIDGLSKAIDPRSETFDDERRNNDRFRKLVGDPYYAEIVKKAALIIGYPLNTSIHASGVLVYEKPLEDNLPVIQGETLIAGFEYKALEAMGYLKFDVLALNYLTFISEIEKNVSAEGKKIPNIYADLAQPKVFQTLNDLKMCDIFQLESPGIQRAYRQIKPQSIEDLSAVLALYRPGPMANIPIYAERKNNHVSYQINPPLLGEILKDTYGIIIYQEQILSIAKKIAGFSGGEADLFRRAISKKDAAKMASMKEKFLQGAIQRGLKQEEAENIYELIEKFADYGFNKAHSYAYAFITYSLAYYKTFFPSAFYLASLRKTALGDPKIRLLSQEMYSYSYSFALPSINRAQGDISFKDNRFIIGLEQIHGINPKLSAPILKEREAGGLFKSLGDFFRRVDLQEFKDQDLSMMVYAGCFDEFGFSREAIIEKLVELKSVFKYAFVSEGDESLPYIEKVKGHKDVRSFLDEFTALGLVVSVHLSELIKGYPRYQKLYLLASDPLSLGGTGKFQVEVIDGFMRKKIYLSNNPGLVKYDIISVNEQISGRYEDITDLNKEEKE